MTTPPPLTSTCRLCRHYAPQGRRGGLCQQLGGRVQSDWQACQFAGCPFGSDAVAHKEANTAPSLEPPMVFAYPSISQFPTSTPKPQQPAAQQPAA